jgi:hypothetical protein
MKVQIETIGDFVTVIILPAMVVVTVLAVGCFLIMHFGRRWEQKNPACSRCGKRKKKWRVSPISLDGRLTSYYICQKHESQANIKAYEYKWACVLIDLHETAKILSDYKITSLLLWPKEDETGRPFGLKEIMMIVQGR